MNLSKTELKAALQAHLDLKYGTSKYTVGDGAEFVALAEDLQKEALKTYHTNLAVLTQSIFAGTLNIRATHDTNPARVTAAHNPLLTQATGKAGYEEHLAASVSVPVGQSKSIEGVFSYVEGTNFEGNFHGYKFEVDTVYSVLEDGTLEMDEAGEIIVRP